MCVYVLDVVTKLCIIWSMKALVGVYNGKHQRTGLHVSHASMVADNTLILPCTILRRMLCD